MPEKQYFIRVRGRILGPFDWPQLRSLRDRGQFNRFHEVSTDRRAWVAASTLPEMFETEAIQEVTAAAPPVAMPVAGPTAQYTQSELNPQSQPPRRPRAAAAAGGSRAMLWGGLAIGALVLIIVTAVGVVLLLSWRQGRDPVSAVLGGSATITSAKDEKGIAAAVGLVVQGARVTRKDGSQVDFPIGQGSCFSVTDKGHLLTNKHVVEEAWKMKHAEYLPEYLRHASVSQAEPRVWVFIGGDKQLATIVHFSDEFDFAVLHIDGKKGPCFRLAAGEDWNRGSKVIACGFPAAAQTAMSPEERVKKLSVALIGPLENVRDYFNPRDFEFGTTQGAVSRVFSEGSFPKRWIQHDASINPGNSGGPLIDDNGVVMGINTARPGDEKSQGIFWSLAMKQLRKEIDKHVGNAVVWE